MLVQKVFSAGNSDVVAIPKSIMKELGLMRGQEVIIDSLPAEDVIIIRKKVAKKSKKNIAVSAEFKKWLKNVLEEDKEILDELLLR